MGGYGGKNIKGANSFENLKSNWKTTDYRFVAFLDILGFKDSVMRNSHEDIYLKLSNINNS